MPARRRLRYIDAAAERLLKLPAITRFQSSSEVASATMKRAFGPIFAATASPSVLRRPVKRTLAPSSTNSSAVRAPMPLVAPVMMPTLPSSMPMALSSVERWGQTPCANVCCRMIAWARGLTPRSSAVILAVRAGQAQPRSITSAVMGPIAPCVSFRP